MYSLRSSFPFQGSDAKKNLARRVIHRITPCDHAHYKHGFLKHERISLLRGLSFVGLTEHKTVQPYGLSIIPAKDKERDRRNFRLPTIE